MADVRLPLTPITDWPPDEDWPRPVTDAGGCTHPSPASALGTLLGLCGCGSVDALQDDAVTVLRWRADQQEAWWSSTTNWAIGPLPAPEGLDERYLELLLHLLNNAELLEHGGSVGGSWPTDLGRQWLAAL